MLTTFAVTLAGYLRMAAIAIAAVLLGVGGTAVAVANVTDSNPSTDPSAVTSTPVEAPKDKAPKDKAPKDKAPKDKAPKDKAPADPAAVPTEVFDSAACAAAANHGAYVSYVAKATKGMPDRGALVSAAAHSDCGKAARAEKAAKTKGDPTAKKEGNRPGKPTKAGKKEGN